MSTRPEDRTLPDNEPEQTARLFTEAPPHAPPSSPPLPPEPTVVESEATLADDSVRDTRDVDQTLSMGSPAHADGGLPAPHPDLSEQTLTEAAPPPRVERDRTEPYTPPPHSPSPQVSPFGGAGTSQGNWATISSEGKLEPGQVVFGRYIVQRELGRGGMGRVWLVRHLTLDADRALKTIVAGIAFDPDARARFAREARAMARFTHPNAVTVHDAMLTGDIAFIEMEYVQGRSLDKLFERGRPMPLDWVDRILRQLCDVLQVAHESGIVHRDLKPSNLMLLDGREPGREQLKVLDFGIAKILGAGDFEGDAHTMTNTVMGTPPYMSPEQAEGRSPQPLPDGRADGRGDLYSVGVMLYEFLTGEAPFRGSMAKKIADTLNTRPPSFHDVNPDLELPPGIEAVVLRCLEKEPANRFQSARELYDAFAAVLPAPPEPVRPVEPVVAPKPPWIVPLALVGALVLGTVGAWQAGLLGEGSSTEPIVPTNGGGPLEPPPPVETPMPAWVPMTTPRGFLAERIESEDGTAASVVFVRDDETRSVRLIPARDAEGLDAAPTTLVREADGVTFRRVEGGTFTKGNLGFPEEPPPASGREVTVPTLYVQEHEVTNGEFRRFLGEAPAIATPSAWQAAHDRLTGEFGLAPDEAARHPAVGVPQHLAAAFAEWAGGRLPTSTEWEYVARSGGRDDRPFVWGTAPRPEIGGIEANIDALDRPGAPTTRVGYFTKDRTEQGIVDLTGNVREWTSTPAPGAPARGGESPLVIVRGGSWKSNADLFLTTAEEPVRAGEILPDLGFRVVLEVETAPSAAAAIAE